LAKRAVELHAANNELEAFAYSVSHDLRAPLRHVAGYTELLQKHAGSALDEKANRYLKTIVEAAKRTGNLIADPLGFSRIGRARWHSTEPIRTTGRICGRSSNGSHSKGAALVPSIA
jgi:light-regulated signal transduction histidine kinase (bacteriophytochrome)